jgi:hypothetical protein
MPCEAPVMMATLGDSATIGLDHRDGQVGPVRDSSDGPSIDRPAVWARGDHPTR